MNEETETPRLGPNGRPVRPFVMPDSFGGKLRVWRYLLLRCFGYWDFAKGELEPGEAPLAAARRELAEEVGLPLAPERVMGCLDDYTTRSGFTITPVVIWGGTDVELTPNPCEVASVHRIPIAELMRACQDFVSDKHKRTVTFEYTLIDGVNDSPEQARKLVKLLRQAGAEAVDA